MDKMEEFVHVGFPKKYLFGVPTFYSKPLHNYSK